MNFIILGDRYQKGQKSLGCQALIQLNKTMHMFDCQYNSIKSCFQNAKIIYVGGFEYKRLYNFMFSNYKDVICLDNTSNYQTFNEAHSLTLIKDIKLSDTFITLGYNELSRQTFKNFQKSDGSQIFVSTIIENQLGCIVNKNMVENISFDLPLYIRNIYYFTKQDTEKILSILSSKKYYNYFLFELVNRLIDTGSVIKPFTCKQQTLRRTKHEYSK